MFTRVTARCGLGRKANVALAVASVLLLLPVLAAAAALVLLTMGRPVFFTQTRAGLHGRPFRIVKFRTMTNAHDGRGQLLADEQRLNATGRLLRATSIDELPQLWNVLVGDMSLVGPRPQLIEFVPLYNPEEARRHEVLPGITGWAQVNGRNAISWNEKLTLDTWYVVHRSVWLDIKILGKTLPTVLSCEGVSAPGHATMPALARSARSGLPDARSPEMASARAIQPHTSS